MRKVLMLCMVGAIILVVLPAVAIAHAMEPAIVTNCKQIPQFATATTATPPIGFGDVGFPTHSVSVTNGQVTNIYKFQITSVCTNSTNVSHIATFYTGDLLMHNYAVSSTYPYMANPAAACGAVKCWRKNGPPKRYISLQQVKQVGTVVTYALWTAIAPLPVYTIVRRSASQAISPHTNGTARVQCSSGEQMLSGGYVSSYALITPYASYPAASNIWRVDASAGTASLTITAYAMCLQANFPIQAHIYSKSGILANYIDVDCPAGTTTIAGGFAMPVGAQILEMINQGSYWEMQGDLNVTGTAYAICAIGMVHEPNVTADFNDTGYQTRTVACPSGFTLVGGGFHYGGFPFPWFQDFPAMDAKHWIVSAVESSSMEPPTANGSCDWFNPF